ncbi:SurA N-terminal domain-containing protein [uncultured Mailhella sp.]|uniref:SurA N-terminal domain-containing protein n=1 Tax=uncultured Mailhella sp. TaxID=1981031 RepID=UPI00262672E6|nr:SurA N-terminal domain-containing protein [uncultured Mailhella sp.]
MLDGIRANSQSFFVKVAFGIIIVVFVFWGIGSYTGPKGLVASVNGRNITEMEFQRTYAQMEENVRRSIPNITTEMMESLHLEQQVLQTLVREKLIEEEAERTGISISPYELRAYLMQLPYFQKDGKFDPEVYKTLLANNHMTPQQFEADQSRILLPGKLQRLVIAGSFVRPEAVKAMYDYAAEQRRVDYILFPAEPHLAAAAPSNEEVASAYESQKDRFTVPPMVDVEYVRLDPAVMGDLSAVSDDELKSVYEERIARYTEPEKVHARHLLIRVASDASESEVKKAEAEIKDLEARIRGGEDFAEAAKAYGQDGTAAQGGDLGWFTAEQMVPEFSKAAFALKAGELSAPVRTQFGFHLIKSEGRQDARVHSFDEVKEKLRADLAVEAASQGLQDKAEAVLAQALAGKSMEEAAGAAGSAAIKPEKTGAVFADELGRKLGLRDADVSAVMGTPAGTVMDAPLSSGAALVVLKVTESRPQTVKPLDEVRSDLVQELTKQKAVDRAMEDARKARAAFQNDAPASGAEIKTSEPFGRGGNIAGLGGDAALAGAVFAVPEVGAAWLKDAFRVNDGAVLARVSAIEAPAEQTWKEMEAAMVANMQAERANMVFQTYLERLASEASIKTFNSPLLRDSNG